MSPWSALEGGGEIPLIQLESKGGTEEKWRCGEPFYTFGLTNKRDIEGFHSLKHQRTGQPSVHVSKRHSLSHR